MTRGLCSVTRHDGFTPLGIPVFIYLCVCVCVCVCVRVCVCVYVYVYVCLCGLTSLWQALIQNAVHCCSTSCVCLWLLCHLLSMCVCVFLHAFWGLWRTRQESTGQFKARLQVMLTTQMSRKATDSEISNSTGSKKRDLASSAAVF